MSATEAVSLLACGPAEAEAEAQRRRGRGSGSGRGGGGGGGRGLHVGKGLVILRLKQEAGLGCAHRNQRHGFAGVGITAMQIKQGRESGSRAQGGTSRRMGHIGVRWSCIWWCPPRQATIAQGHSPLPPDRRMRRRCKQGWISSTVAVEYPLMACKREGD